MNINNLDRAVEAKKELHNLDEAIKNLNNFKSVPGEAGFVISEYTDHSGNSVNYLYVNENYHPVYAEILDFAKKRFKVARDQLIAEIRSL